MKSLVLIAIENQLNLRMEKLVSCVHKRRMSSGIKNEWMCMQVFLRDAETIEEDDERVSTWISEIREIGYKTEDIIDTMGALKAFRWKIFFRSGNTHLSDVAREINDIKRRLKELHERKVRYCLSIKLYELRKNTSATEHDVVGFEEALEYLEAKSLHPEPKRIVVSLLGMGGSAKTTIARKLYNINKSKFHNHVWVCVSHEWTPPMDLLKRFIKSVKYLNKGELEGLERMDDNDMNNYLHDLLIESQYLLVINDTWDEQVWQLLKNALPENENGSRIIVITCNRGVAQAGRTYVHQLQALKPYESLDLFCKNAFESGRCS